VPLVKILVAMTFVVGLMPIAGNLISNTAIVIVCLSQGVGLAVISLAYLVIIHKLEYFLNARIIGSHVNARAWELLIAMLVMQAAFGLVGLIAAPIYYTYFKDEFRAKGLV
jgi:predicted PurR-regulated permease PerM